MSNGWRLSTLASVAAILLMRLLQKTIEYQFIVLAGTSSSSNGVTSEQETMATVTSWIYTCRYLLPVLGGLLACWLGHQKILQLGGCVILITTVLMSVAIFLNSWTGDSAIAMVACLSMLVLNGLVIPSVMQGVLSKRTEPRYRTVLCALIYASSAAGLFVGVKILNLAEVLGHQYGLVCLLIAAAFCALSAPLSMSRARVAAKLDGFRGADEDAGIVNGRGWSEFYDVLELLTHNRMKRSFLVFSAPIPFLLGLCDDRASVFKAELSYLKNLTDSDQHRAAGDGGSGALDMVTSTVLSVALVMLNIAMVTASCFLGRPEQRLSIRARIIYGICQQTALEFALAIVSSGVIRFVNLTALEIFYTAASVVDAASAVLVLVAAYELMDGFERDSARPLIVSVMLTVWGVGMVASRLLVTVCHEFLRQEQQFAYHVILLIMLAISLIYTWFCALPLAKQLTVTYSWKSHDGSEEAEGRTDEADSLINRAT